MMTNAAFGLLALTLAAPAAAHDFWLQPSQWRPTGSADVEIALEVGHAKDRQRSAIAATRLVMLDVVQADGSRVDLLPRLHLGEAQGDLSVTTARSAVPTMVVLVTDTDAESRLPAERFNAYLKSEGLSSVIAWRSLHQRSAAEGSESYGRVAKALFRSQSDAPAVRRPLGLELEIVPLKSPYSMEASRRLPVQIHFRNAPLPAATVKLYDLANDTTPKATCLTDPNGCCTFAFQPRGAWLVNVIWSVPNQPGNPTDFRTIFSSLSFGFDPPNRSVQ